MAGRYSQAPADDYLAQSQSHPSPHKGAGGVQAGGIRQSTADHAILSMQYKAKNTLLRIEPYWKEYHHLPLLKDS